MNQQEEDPDVYYISKGESHLHISDWIYEFINLSIPMQRMCREEDIGGPYCNKEVLEMLKKLETEKSRPGGTVWKRVGEIQGSAPGAAERRIKTAIGKRQQTDSEEINYLDTLKLM